jgi:predicted house-cleaning noncanonical NTP pyrophosphatase (MazG superfamily)
MDWYDRFVIFQSFFSPVSSFQAPFNEGKVYAQFSDQKSRFNSVPHRRSYGDKWGPEGKNTSVKELFSASRLKDSRNHLSPHFATKLNTQYLDNSGDASSSEKSNSLRDAFKDFPDNTSFSASSLSKDDNSSPPSVDVRSQFRTTSMPSSTSTPSSSSSSAKDRSDMFGNVNQKLIIQRFNEIIKRSGDKGLLSHELFFQYFQEYHSIQMDQFYSLLLNDPNLEVKELIPIKRKHDLNNNQTNTFKQYYLKYLGENNQYQVKQRMKKELLAESYTSSSSSPLDMLRNRIISIIKLAGVKGVTAERIHAIYEQTYGQRIDSFGFSLDLKQFLSSSSDILIEDKQPYFFYKAMFSDDTLPVVVSTRSYSSLIEITANELRDRFIEILKTAGPEGMTGSTLTYAYSKKHCQSIPTLTDGNKFSMRVLLSCLPNIQINDCVSMETGKTYWKYVYVPSASSTAVSSSALRPSSSSSAPLSVSSASVQLPSTVNDQQLSEETAVQSDLLLYPSSSGPPASTTSSIEGKASALMMFPPDVVKRIIKVVRSFGGKGRLVSFLPKDYYRMYGEKLIYEKGTFHQLLSAIPGLRLREVFKNDSYALFVDWKPTPNTQQVSTVVDQISSFSSSIPLSPSSSSSSSLPHIAVHSSNRTPDAEIDMKTERLISNAMINTKQDLASSREAVRSSSSEQKNDISIEDTDALTSSSSSTTNKKLTSSSPLMSSTHPSNTSPTVVSMNSPETTTQLSSSLSSDKLFSLVRERLIEIVKASGKEGIHKSEIFKKYYEMFQEKLHLSFPYLPKSKNNLNSLLSSLSTVSVSHNIMSPSKCRCFYIGSLSTPSSTTVPAFTSKDSTGTDTGTSTSTSTPRSSSGNSSSNLPPVGKKTTEKLDVPGYYSLSFSSSSSELHPLSSSATKIYGSHPKINGHSGHISKEVLRKKGIEPFPRGVEVSHLGNAISPDVSSSSWLTKKISEIFQKG